MQLRNLKNNKLWWMNNFIRGLQGGLRHEVTHSKRDSRNRFIKNSPKYGVSREHDPKRFSF